jgi:hypothetical protein
MAQLQKQTQVQLSLYPYSLHDLYTPPIYSLAPNCPPSISPNVLLRTVPSCARIPVLVPSLSLSSLCLRLSNPPFSSPSSPTIHPGTLHPYAPGSRSRRYAVPTAQPSAAAITLPGN